MHSIFVSPCGVFMCWQFCFTRDILRPLLFVCLYAPLHLFCLALHTSPLTVSSLVLNVCSGSSYMYLFRPSGLPGSLYDSSLIHDSFLLLGLLRTPPPLCTSSPSPDSLLYFFIFCFFWPLIFQLSSYLFLRVVVNFLWVYSFFSLAVSHLTLILSSFFGCFLSLGLVRNKTRRKFVGIKRAGSPTFSITVKSQENA